MFQEAKEFTKKAEAKAEELKALMKKEGESALKALFKDVFDEFPKITEIKWGQATPGFNDGEPCYFQIHTINFTIDGTTTEDGSYDAPEGFKKVTKEIESFIFKFKDTLEILFGDGTEVTVTPKGLQAEDGWDCGH